MSYDRQHVISLVKSEQWGMLCAYHRSWLQMNCSLYTPDKVEEIIASWVSRMILVVRQLKKERKQPEEENAEIIHNVTSHWDSLLNTYNRWQLRVFNVTPAEERIQETINRCNGR